MPLGLVVDERTVDVGLVVEVPGHLRRQRLAASAVLPIGRIPHACCPSEAWTLVAPWNVSSIRALRGRLRSIVTGASKPGPMVMWPSHPHGVDGAQLVDAAAGLAQLRDELVDRLGGRGSGERGAHDETHDGLAQHGFSLLGRASVGVDGR